MNIYLNIFKGCISLLIRRISLLWWFYFGYGTIADCKKNEIYKNSLFHSIHALLSLLVESRPCCAGIWVWLLPLNPILELHTEL